MKFGPTLVAFTVVSALVCIGIGMPVWAVLVVCAYPWVLLVLTAVGMCLLFPESVHNYIQEANRRKEHQK